MRPSASELVWLTTDRMRGAVRDKGKQLFKATFFKLQYVKFGCESKFLASAIQPLVYWIRGAKNGRKVAENDRLDTFGTTGGASRAKEKFHLFFWILVHETGGATRTKKKKSSPN